MNRKKRFLYKPSIYIFLDLLFQAFNFLVVLEWFPLTTQRPFGKYKTSIVAFIVIWLGISYLLGRYRNLSLQKNWVSLLKLFYTSIIVFFINVLLFTRRESLSESVLFLFVFGIFLINLAYLLLYFSYRYASDPEQMVPRRERGEAKLLKPDRPLDAKLIRNRNEQIINYSGNTLLGYLASLIDMASANVVVLATTNVFNIKNFPYYRFATIVNLEPLNNIRGINAFFFEVNEKLPDDGLFIGCFKDKSTRKKELLRKYPFGIRYVIYSFYFLFKRVMPAFFLTRRLYYDITRGKNRVLAKAEVYGRLYYCGFEVIGERKIKGATYYVARRKTTPPLVKKRIYGPLIRLHRVGKNGKMFKVYKFRTMYPYSEYLQEYIYEKNTLKEGGKFNHDIRVTTLGRFFRRVWLDELPMFINFFKGEMKLVGVRPLSNHYFSLYNKELQEKRTQFKPGLLPPFYADMPKTLDEIQASEMRYLNACEKRGTFVTDVMYLFKIAVNIVFKKARSN